MADTRNQNTPAHATPAKPVKPVDVEPVEKPGNEVGGSCNLPGCPYDAEVRGLCDAHWGTHRGLADPAEDEPKVKSVPEVTLP